MVLKQVGTGSVNAWQVHDLTPLGIKQPTVSKIRTAIEKAAIAGTFTVVVRKAGFVVEVTTKPVTTIKDLD